MMTTEDLTESSLMESGGGVADLNEFRSARRQRRVDSKHDSLEHLR